MKKWLPLLVVLWLLPAVVATLDLNSDLSETDQAQVDEILGPIVKAYQILRYIASLIGVIAIVVAGITLTIPNTDPAKKKLAKAIILSALGGMILVIFAPNIVGLLTG